MSEHMATPGDDHDAGVEPIAVVGLACRLPGAADVSEFWRNLADGVEGVRFYTREEQAALGVPDYMLDDPNFVPAASILDAYADFDSAFFGMSPREAALRDPQHRVFLELADTALEDAGYDPAGYGGEIGVYGAVGADEYQWLYVRPDPEVYSAVGFVSAIVANHPDYLATLTSYKLDLRGPSVTLHAACSTSLVAVHVACEALRNGECDMALTGGVSMEMPAEWGYMYSPDGIYSPDGHCRAFDASAAGTVWGSGGAMVVLKRLSDAIADGDHVRAVVLGNAINNDGASKVGFSAPSAEGQAAVITQALGVAGVDPRTVTYVEAHGTGTIVGDPIEVAGLSSVFARDSSDRGWCAIGSVKTNIGHLGPAAGIAGLTKAVLALEHGLIPPSLNFEKPNPKIDFEQSPFYVNAAARSWETNGVPRRAGVSSFGIGGTNAHAVLEEAPRVERVRPPERPAHLLQLSAMTPGALEASVQRLGAHLAEHPQLDLADVAYTLRVGRRELAHRAAVAASHVGDAVAALADPRRLVKARAGSRAPQVGMLFTGQGAQYPGMGAGLYAAEPVFREAVDECAETLSAELGLDLRELLLGGGGGAADERLDQTAFTQPALFTVEYALARLWLACGVEPSGMIGHSIGEFVAATLAGVFALPDALRLVAARGRLMQSMPPGSMLAVRLEEGELRDRLPDGVALAAVNGPGACVASGPTPLVEELAGRLEADDVGSTALRTSHAFHSPMMEPILGEFRELVAAVDRGVPTRPFLSNVTGDWISDAEATDPSYWARHIREAVRFGDCVSTLLSQGEWVLLECGPGHQLCGLARRQLPRDAAAPLPSLPGPRDERGDLEVLLGAAGGLWVAGAPVRTRALGIRAYRVPLPTYPWERRRHWFETPPDPGVVYQPPVQTGPLPVEEWFSVPAWSQQPPLLAQPAPFERCVAFTDDGPGAELAAALRAAGLEVDEVRAGEHPGRDADGRYVVRPAHREDYDALIADLGGAPGHIVHAWTMRGEPARTPDAAWQAQDLGFFSLLCLTQAVAATQPDHDVQLDILSAGTRAVTGADLVRPEHATLAGIARVVPLEAPWLSVRQVDLDLAGLGASWADEALRELFSEPGEMDVVALRAGRRWRERFESVPLPASDARLRHRGVYLITGGLGGIGLTLAEDLARRCQARLVLLSRSGLPPQGDGHRKGRAIAAVRRMEDAGAEVMVVAADVSRPADLARVREQTLSRFGRLDGIVHAAGVAGGGMAEVKEREAAEAVLRPKLLGTLALRETFGDLELDFVVLCSSVTAVAGGFGQVDYCAANNFLDAHAAGVHGWRARVVSVNWGGWAEVGMAAEVSAPTGFRALQRGDRVVAVDHPVLTGTHVDEGQGLAWFSGVVSPGTHWLLDEHRIAGVAVMPGTGYLEAARCAFEAAVPRPAEDWVVELRDVAFVAPMPVADDATAEVRVLLSPGADGVDFEVVTWVDEAPQVHARGSAAWVQPPPADPVDLAALRERCSVAERTDAGELFESGSGLLEFGSRWRSLRRVYVGRDEELAELEAAPVVAGERERFGLHPALLDEATAFAHPPGEGSSYLPLGYGRVLVRGPLPAQLWSHVEYRDGGSDEVVTTDLSLFDRDGAEVVRINDFVLRRVDPDAMASTVDEGARATSEQVHVPEESAAAIVAATPEAPPDAIRPSDGADAFRRLVGADVGPQVVTLSIPLERFVASTRQLTQETVEQELDPAVAAGRPAHEAGGSRVAARTELEATLAAVWGEVLGTDQVSVEDNFFDLGGNSLVAVQLMALTRKRVGVRLPMRSLFEQPTVAGMAALVEELRASQSQAEPSGIPALARERRAVREEERA